MDFCSLGKPKQHHPCRARSFSDGQDGLFLEGEALPFPEASSPRILLLHHQANQLASLSRNPAPNAEPNLRSQSCTPKASGHQEKANLPFVGARKALENLDNADETSLVLNPEDSFRPAGNVGRKRAQDLVRRCRASWLALDQLKEVRAFST